jgi:lipid A 3-O-deacylase
MLRKPLPRNALPSKAIARAANSAKMAARRGNGNKKWGGMLRRLAAFGCVIGLLAASAPRPAGATDYVVDAIALSSALLVVESLFVPTPDENEPDFISFEAGRFDAVSSFKPSTEFGSEYRSGYFLWKFKPFVGVGVTTNESFYGYGGIRLDTYWFDRRFIVTPSFALVAYDRGSGKNLGSPGVARSGLDFQYRFDGDYRVGVDFHHMSMGKIFGSYNPGTEIVGLTFSMPVAKLMGDR